MVSSCNYGRGLKERQHDWVRRRPQARRPSGRRGSWARVRGHALDGRFVGGQWVKQTDPFSAGFGDTEMQSNFKYAIYSGSVHHPDDFDLATQQPFYALMVKPGVEHLRDATPDGTVAQNTPDVGTGAYHFGFTYSYGDSRPNWDGEACWVKSGTTAVDTLGSLVHEMAEAYAGREVSDLCQSQTPVLVEGVRVPQFWSAADNSCWPPPDSNRMMKSTPVVGSRSMIPRAGG